MECLSDIIGLESKTDGEQQELAGEREMIMVYWTCYSLA